MVRSMSNPHEPVAMHATARGLARQDVNGQREFVVRVQHVPHIAHRDQIFFQVYRLSPEQFGRCFLKIYVLITAIN
jgi:hypothetical protein